PLPILIEVAHRRARELGEGKLAQDVKERRRQAGQSAHFKQNWLLQLAREENPLGRRILFDWARRRLRKKTRGKYPAPERLLEVVRLGIEEGPDAGLAAEAKAFGELVVSDVSRRLVEVFFATTALSKDRGTEDPKAQPRTVRKVGILG